MDDDQLRERIDSCRPASDDLAQPEMAELALRAEGDAALSAVFRKSEHWDAALSAAFHDVSVPEGLKQRLLEACALGAAAAETEQVSAAASEVSAARTPLRISRRKAALMIAVAAIAAVVLLSVWLPRGPRMSQAEFSRQAPGWIDALEVENWRDMSASPASTERLANLRLAFVPDQWQPLDVAGIRGAAFEDSQRRSVRAVLLMIEARSTESLPESPPVAPASQTGGWQVGVWKSDGKTYVLAVQGSQQDYRDVALPRRTIIALHVADNFS